MDKISKLDSLEKQRSAIKEQLDSWTTERTIEFKLLFVDKEILDVAIDICNVEHYLDKTSWDSHEKERFGSKEYLRKEKEQLRKEKEQLRKEKERLRKEKEQLREQQNILMLAASRNINEITHDSFLNYSPPKINFSLTKKSEKESKSSGPRAHPKEPANVLSWDNFLSNAKSFLLQKHGTISPPTFTDYAATVSDEQILHGHIDFNILNPINHLLISLGSEFLFTGHSEIITPLKGWPDHVLHDNGKLRSFIETKTIWDLPTPQPNETIIQWWNEDVLAESSQSTRQNTRPSIFHVIGQVYGYQSNHELKYGMLTNGEVVWFLFRPNLPDVPTNLLISPPISIVGESPTLFRSIMYFISLVNEGHISGDSPISSPMAGQPPTLISRGKYVQDVPIDLANNLSLLKERIGGGTSGNVFKYTMSDSSLIAVKCCDKLNNKAGYKMMKNEIKIYQMLSALQGNIIPYLRFSGFSGEMFLIGTTYIEGKRIEDIEILEKVLGKFKEKLALYNIEHGDLREQNILEDESGKHWVFDFGMSSVIKSN